MADALKVLRLIETQARLIPLPSVTGISLRKDPFQVLVSCILSLRTKDKTTLEASERLFARASTPAGIAKLSSLRIERLIYPVGFYRVKSKVIRGLSRRIVKEFDGRVPHTLPGLLQFKGVGRKTANLVLGLGYGIPAICVDTHVHRISNRLGWVRTSSPEDTEKALAALFPRRLWIRLNTLLVGFGQHVCLPVLPHCSGCRVDRF
ncbi:MAG: endonuclease III, partial [Candidatus Omnitrophica bacterium]|nr:endonuclease III [Candidatus Omnitrophota bacterium]